MPGTTTDVVAHPAIDCHDTMMARVMNAAAQKCMGGKRYARDQMKNAVH
jgi:hypothetical protein